MTTRNPTPPGMDASPKNTDRTTSLQGNVTPKPLTTICANSADSKPSRTLTTFAFDSMPNSLKK